MNIKLQIAFFIVTGIVIIVGIFWSSMTEKRLRKFFLGKKGKDLEDLILHLEEDIKNLTGELGEVKQKLSVAESKIKKSIRGVHTLRFNPFSDQGSNQSFAIGMLDEDGDGVVVSSLYSRERMSVFAKPITSGKSEYELSSEEKTVLGHAKEKIK